MKIIYGSGNKEKVKEVETFFKNNVEGIEILTLKDIGFEGDIIEDGETFEENSLIKARAIKSYCDEKNINEIIITDDAGLCVDALNGRPGVLSARYAGDHAPQEVTINKLLDEMRNVPKEKRTARFVCVLTAIMPDGEVITAKGVTEGSIALEPGPMGKLTFFPVFVPDEYGKAMIYLTDDELKHTHREKAMIDLLSKLDIEEKLSFGRG